MYLCEEGKDIVQPVFDHNFIEEFASSISSIDLRCLISVDGGSIGVATEWLQSCWDCDETYLKNECTKCGRNSTNYIDFRSGQGDGVYPVFTIVSDMRSIGSLILFDSDESLDSIGNIYSNTINDLPSYEEEKQIEEALEEVDDLFSHFFGSYEVGLPIYNLGTITVRKLFQISDSNFQISNQKGYFVIGEAGEGIDSSYCIGTVTYLDPGDYVIFLIGNRDVSNNNILIPSFAMILEKQKASNLGLLSDNIPQLNLEKEKSRWNNSRVFAHVGSSLSETAFYSNTLYHTSCYDLYSMQNVPTEQLKYVAIGAASWLMMLNSVRVVPNKNWEEQISKILQDYNADASILHELRGQLNRKII